MKTGLAWGVGSILVAAASAGCATAPGTEASASIASFDGVGGPPVVCGAGDAPAGATDVGVGFRVLGRTEGAPATSGGPEEGVFTVDQAQLLLPSSAGFLVRLSRSSGTVNGWAEFSGGHYRLHIRGDVSIALLFGAPITQNQDVDKNGSYVVTGSTMNFTPVCPDDGTFNEVTFSSTGDRGTIVVPVPTDYGTSYFVLQGPKSAPTPISTPSDLAPAP